jgi:hypothetical protein
MSAKAICPVCWHEETFRALKQHCEPVHDDPQYMLWQRPYGGARGQVVTVWDEGRWNCPVCGVSLTPRMAAILLDAVLRVSDPNSDSFDGETFEDARVANKGGM